MERTARWIILWSFIFILFEDVSFAQEQKGLELMLFEDIPVVTLATRSHQTIMQTPAAVSIITAEDIRRSGHTSIPELLRMVPGMEVAHQTANVWAVSARGFNGWLSNKFLVLIDGRTVYNPIFAGVDWDSQNVLLEDIERIEVIRGPGGTMWGSNAVNGIINVVTKSAKNTQGSYITGGAGTLERGFGSFRYGAKSKDNLYYRFYTSYFSRNNFLTAGGTHADDQWRVPQGGFRMDWDATGDDTLSVSGNFYKGEVHHLWKDYVILTRTPFNQSTSSSDKIYGANILARWAHDFSKTSDMALQFYYDRSGFNNLILDRVVDTVDIDFQHRFGWGDRQEFIWGTGYRCITDEMDGTFTLSFDPDSVTQHNMSAFAQDKITIVPERSFLIVGSKFEYNYFSGFEYQPSLRFLWQPRQEHAVWSAITRAVRTPARTDRDLRLNYTA